MNYEYFMNEALKEARKALKAKEVPIGAVIVFDNKIIGRGYNKRNKKKNPLYHAEIIAINKAAKAIGDWRLEDCTMFVTLEPCPMCAGAIIQSRIPKVVIGTKNIKSGSCGTVINILNDESFNHQSEVVMGVLEEECKEIVQKFFSNLRKELKEEKNKNSDITE